MSLVKKTEDEIWVNEITDKEFEEGKIAKLPNHPNRGASYGETGLTAPQLKAYFDKNIELLKGRVNAIIEKGNPNTIAGKIEIGSINGWDDIATLYDFIVAMNEGGLSDKFFVKFEDEEQLYLLNEFLQSLQKDKVQSKQGGTDKGKVYIIDENSDDALLGYSEDATPNSIVKRTESGDILVPEGSTNDDAAISRKDAAALLSEAVTKDVFEAEKNRTNTFVKSAKVEYDEANHVIRLTFTDGNGETDTSSVDLPLEMAFVGARLEEGNLVFTLQNGQEVSVPIGDVLGGLVTSGALAQSLSGNEEDKAPSVKAVNEGLSKKLDAKDQLAKGKSYVYAVDYDNTQKLFMTSMHGSPGDVVMYGHTTNTGKTKPNGTIGVNMPEQPYQATPREYVDKGLAGKVDYPTTGIGSYKIFGTGKLDESTGRYATNMLTRNANGTGNMFVASFSPVSDAGTFNRTDDNFVRNLKYTLGVPDPLYPIQVANKRYVDNKYRDLEHSVYNALGVLYTFESVKLGRLYNEIPNGALSIAYLESIGGVNVYSTATGEPVLVGTTDILAIHINGANSERLSTFDPTAPQYIELPEGAVAIVFEYREPTVSVWDMLEIDASIKYQIKVGA